MTRQIKGAIALLVLGIIIIASLKLLLPIIKEKKQIETSDAGEIKDSITIGVDNWIGYYPLCSKQMKKLMRSLQYKLTCEDDSGDYPSRMRKLKEGQLNLAVATVDSYLINAAPLDFPGAIIMVIDESKGGDAVVARKNKLSNLNDLKTKNYKIAYTPDSPSAHFLKTLAAHFDIPKLMSKGESWKEHTKGSTEALTKLLSGKVDAAVLWEPDVSKALSDPNIVKLIGTDDTANLIVDILIVNRDFIQKKPEIIHKLLSNYFRVLKDFKDNPESLEEEVLSATNLNKDQVSAMLKGAALVNLTDNAEKWFGISLPASASSASMENLVDTIDSVIDTLIISGDFSSNPLPDEDPYRIINSKTIEQLYVHGISGQFDSQGKKPAIDSLKDKFLPLTDEQWETLKEVGTLKTRPITFMSGTSRLSLEGKEDLDKLVSSLKHYPNFRIIIKGHTGIKGDIAANKTLSQERADAVKQYIMVTYNIVENRIRSLGVGSAEPLPRNADESDRAYAYRLPRVELYLVKEVY
ncbi:OmpA/MotB domain-containing protein [Candidatus Magnetoovum chiemensis]|nr:OmpA/MotB domain-containing protein [Candidatus Magnetoovum chiemensis]